MSEAPKTPANWERPGRSVERCLLTLPGPERLPFLDYAEQQARRRGDIEIQEARSRLPPDATGQAILEGDDFADDMMRWRPNQNLPPNLKGRPAW